ncbi:MAG: hypothetical protein AB7G37_02000 [Solirubrobacteraceae bacterium]
MLISAVAFEIDVARRTLFVGERRVPFPIPANLRPDTTSIRHTIAWILSVYDTALSPAAIPDEQGTAEALATQWATSFASVARSLHAHREPPEIKCRAAHANLLLDAMADILSAATDAGVSPEEAISRLTAPQDPLSRAPFFGQLRQVKLEEAVVLVADGRAG